MADYAFNEVHLLFGSNLHDVCVCWKALISRILARGPKSLVLMKSAHAEFGNSTWPALPIDPYDTTIRTIRREMFEYVFEYV